MNIKYKDLSVIGKIWTIAEMFHAGLRDNKNAYIVATFRKLEELLYDQEAQTSKAVLSGSIENIIASAEIQKELIWGETENAKLYDYGSIVELIWFNRIAFDAIKRRIKDDSMLGEDLAILDAIYREIKGLWVSDLKAKQLRSEERRDLFKIKEEIEDLKIKIENKVKRNQITII